MHERTILTLSELEKSIWFRNVGVKDTDKAIILSSWDEAIKHCSEPNWEDLCLEATNRFSELILRKSKERYNKWNEIVEDIKENTISLVKSKIEHIVKKNHLPSILEDTVQWDILHLCIESEFADIVEPGFYASQAYWYVAGHFPCGWMGDFPDGKLIIF